MSEPEPKHKISFNVSKGNDITVQEMVKNATTAILDAVKPVEIEQVFPTSRENQPDGSPKEMEKKVEQKEENKTERKWVSIRLETTVETFLEPLKAVGKLTDQVNLDFQPQGIYIRAMDPIRVAMVDAVLPKDQFEMWSLPEPFKVGVNLEELFKILRKEKKQNSLEIYTIANDTKQRLYFKAKSATITTYSLDSIDLGNEELPTPKIDHTAFMKLVANSFTDEIEKYRDVVDQVTFLANPKFGEENFVIAGNRESGDTTSEFKRGSEALLNIEFKGLESNSVKPVEAIYAMNYLLDIASVGKNNGNTVVELSYSDNMPLRVAYPYGYGAVVAFWLAPRRKVE